MFTIAQQPSLPEVLAAPSDAFIPVWQAFPADTETPISAFLKLRRGGTGFLLESAEQDGSIGRYSFIGVSPDAVLRAGLDRGTVETEAGLTTYEGDPLAALRRLVGEAPVHYPSPDIPGFVGGAVGMLSYDLVQCLEKLRAVESGEPQLPVGLFGRYATLVVFDHLKQRILVVSVIPPDTPREEAYHRASARVERVWVALRRAPAAPPFEPVESEVDSLLESAGKSPEDDTFVAAVARAREYVLAGDAIQVVLSRRLCVPFAGDPFRLYRALRILNPSPYMFFLDFPEVSLVGASPEMLLRVSGDAAQICPIAGTRPRGSSLEEDTALEGILVNDPKERAEHVMLVDLGRNDLGRVSRIGSVQVPSLMRVERFSHVMHLASTVTGRLREDVDALGALAACFPAGTVSGAPKVRAMEIIQELEKVRRGPYAGGVGYVSFGGRTLDTCITIRSVVVQNGSATLQVGAGIVADSDPQRELEETNAKARAMLAALALCGAGRERVGSPTAVI